MNPTVTVLLEEFDKLRKLASNGEKFEAMRDQLQHRFISPDFSLKGLYKLEDIRRMKPVLRMSESEMREFLETWFG